ncbi:hypothetical protein [Burkholderia ubonensis]|nr:hypothetical protein [Burkholderia ubonensis]
MTPLAVQFLYTLDRESTHSQQHLESFNEVFQIDAYLSRSATG